MVRALVLAAGLVMGGCAEGGGGNGELKGDSGSVATESDVDPPDTEGPQHSPEDEGTGSTTTGIGTESSSSSDTDCGDCVDDLPTESCEGAADCNGVCLQQSCIAAASCKELHQAAPTLQSGSYPLVLDPTSDEPAIPFWCDMETDGGGWTVVYATDGRDGNAPLVGFDVAVGNPLLFEHYNLHMLDKVAVNGDANEFLVRRPGGRWLVADTAPFVPEALLPMSERYFPVMLRTNDGTSANGWLGWSNHNIAGGGDFGLATTDGQTCDGDHFTVDGFDHHSTAYWNVNCGCAGQYLYSYSSAVRDGDAKYDAGIGLGEWDATAGCNGAEGGGLLMYAAIR